MFDLIQNHKRLIMIALFVLIIPPFALFGVDSYFQGMDRSKGLAQVGDYSISQQEFNRALGERQDAIQRMMGGKAGPELLDNAELRFAVLDELIRRRVLLDQAARSGLTVSDVQLRSLISELPAFQDSGNFSIERYEQYLRSQGMTPVMFEARLRQDILLQQITDAYSASGFIPRSVAERLVRITEQQREVSQFVVPAEKFLSQVKLDADAARKYYDANQEEFRIPEQVRVEYVVLSMDALLPQMQIDPAEVRKYYDSHLGQYGTQEERQASHILIAVEASAPPEQKQKARAMAQELYKQLTQNPKSFADLARQHSQDPGSAARGGDLGYFGRGSMIKPFEDAAFQMKVGDISAPVESQYGFHIIRLDAVRPSKVRSFDEVRAQIETEFRKQQAGKKFSKIAEDFNNTVFEQSESLKPAAALAQASVQQSGWITRERAGEPQLNHPRLLQAIFSQDTLANQRNTEAVEVAPGVLVAARLLERKPASLQAFADVSAEIIRKLTLRQANQLATQEGRALLEKLRQGQDAQAAWSPASMVSRAETKGLGEAVLRQVFKTDVAKLPAYAGVENPQGGFALIRISRVVEPEKVEVEKQKSVAEGLQQVISQQELSAYVDSLKRRADVRIARDLVA